jgi:hypothetical protein
MGATVLTMAQVNGRVSGQNADAVEAGVLAQSAVEYALLQINTDSSWRTDYNSGDTQGPWTLGNGAVSFKLVDEVDGNLANAADDPVRIYGIGKVRNATRMYSVSAGTSQSLNCLSVASASAGNIVLGSSTITGTATMSSNGTITGAAGAFGGTNLEAQTAVTLTLCTGSGYRHAGSAQGFTAKVFPDNTHVFDYYTSNGTTIPFSSIPQVGVVPLTTATIDGKLISPAVNSVGGGTNTKGIYIINCGGQNLVIQNTRVVGTLVVLNAGTVTIQNSGVYEPAITNLPTLLVQGNIALKLNSTTALSESGTTQFNPIVFGFA